MIDRIEELLLEMAEEEDEEEQEDVPAVTEQAVPASSRDEDKGEAGDGGTEDRSGGRTAGEIISERPGMTVRENEDSGTQDRGGGQAAKKSGAVVNSGLKSERSKSGEASRGWTAFAQSESLDCTANRRSVTTEERRGAVISNGLRSERSKSGEAQRGRTAFVQSESLGRTTNRRSVTTGEITLERLGRMAGGAGDDGAESRSGGRTAGEIAQERPGLIAGETAAERAETAGELWKDGPVWTMHSVEPEMDEVQRAAAAGRTAQAEKAVLPLRDGGLSWTGMGLTARGGIAGLALEGAGRSRAAQAGLEGLYRQTVRGLRPAAPALPSEQAGKTARVQEPGSAASLAVDELDRAVRRDSRRYDGGMSIY